MPKLRPRNAAATAALDTPGGEAGREVDQLRREGRGGLGVLRHLVDAGRRGPTTSAP
jgi:hypothetical protein